MADAKIRELAENLAGDTRDALVVLLQEMRVPWGALTESEQTQMLKRAKEVALHVVARSLTIMARRGFDVASLSIESFTVGRLVRGQFQAERDGRTINLLSDFQGREVMVVFASPEDFMGERAPAVAEPDQRKLDLGEARRKRSKVEASEPSIISPTFLPPGA